MVSIRPMEVDDLEQVTAIERENFSVPWNELSFFTYLFREGTVFLVAEEDGKILGYLGMISAADEADITNVSVSKDARRRGTGTKLVERLCEEAKKLGTAKMFLEVRKSNEPAISLYEKLGFEQVGVRKNYYEAPVEDALLMLKNL